MEETVDQKFIRLLAHKLDSNLNLVEKGMKDFPCFLGIPESTFIKLGFDRQDISEMLKKYQFFDIIREYKKFMGLPSNPERDDKLLAGKARDFFSELAPDEWEDLYVLLVFPSDVEQMYRKLFATHNRRAIEYNSTTGVGILRKKSFKLKDDQPEFVLFKELYENYNEPVKRDDVLKIFKRPDSSAATIAINNLVKKIRTRTGLTTEELVLNNGNVTLSI